MFILDFNTDTFRALRHGFLKGLAAPVSLHHTESVPKVRVNYVHPQTADSACEAMRSDWVKIGRDLQGVIENEQKSKQAALAETADE
jgi:hypothetical protein